MANIFFNSSDDDNVRRKKLYDGDIYVFGPTEAGKAFVKFAREFCEEAFSPNYPPNAQHSISPEQYTEILKKLKPEFIHHPECKKFIPQLLAELNCDLNETYFDVPRIRTACAGDYLSSGLAYAFKPHRDTWYSTPMCQLNWWMPIYPIEPDNGMAFHPQYWNRPIKNSSREFNYQNWNLVGRKQAHNQGKKDTRVQSEALEPIETGDDLRLVCEPGGVIVFSAAHLHSTVPNVTNQTRFSIDFRTVNSNDINSETGARNIDSESTGTTMMDYLCGSTKDNFDERIIEEFKNKLPKLQPV